MRRCQLNLTPTSLFLMLALAGISLETEGAEPPSLPGKNLESGAAHASGEGQHIPQRPIVSGEAAELEIAFGRLRLMPRRFRVLRRHETFANDEGWRTVQVSTFEGRPTLRAAYRDASESWTLQLDATVGAQWSRELMSNGRPLRIDYSQKPHEPIVIIVTGQQAAPVQLRGATLWHLTAQNAPTFAQCVVPALQRLNAAWDLRQTLSKAKQFREQVGLTEPIDPKALARWVNDLESSDSVVRANATHELRLAGVCAQMPLVELTHGPLSTQQRKTIEQILAALEPETADTPTRLAYWLSGDPSWR